MKLLRYGPLGKEKPGMLDADGIVRDLSGLTNDIDGAFLESDRFTALRSADASSFPAVPEPGRIGACVARPEKFICIGLNYADHAEESGMPIPEKPIVFMKVCRATGPNDTVTIPKGSVRSDWEVELGVVIGTTASHVSEEAALDHVAGYCVINDLSEREFQFDHGGQWVKGKSCDGFGPIGPWLVTKDEVADPQNLSLWLEVNGHRYQNGTTAKMVFTVVQLVSHLSRFMTLYPGDVISTGTPPGVGLGQKPPVYLKGGDEVRLGIEGLGEQNQRYVAFA